MVVKFETVVTSSIARRDNQNISRSDLGLLVKEALSCDIALLVVQRQSVLQELRHK